MHGEFDPAMEGDIPPPAAIDDQPNDPEPGVRRDYHVIEAELDLVDRSVPDAPRRQPEQAQPHTDRAEDLFYRSPPTRAPGGKRFPGILEWNDDGAWDDSFGLDVVESF